MQGFTHFVRAIVRARVTTAALPAPASTRAAIASLPSEQGKGYAIYLMGEIYQIGQFGVERNLNLAIEWLSKGDPWCT